MATDKSTKDSHDLHIVMFPFFAFGHVSPFIQLSNKLSSHGIRITFFTIPGFVQRLKTLLIPSPSTKIIALKLDPSLGLPENLAGTAELSESEAGKLITAMDLTKPQVEALLSELKPHLVLFDFTHYWLPSLASKLGIKSMFFNVLSAIAIGYHTAIERQASVDRAKLTLNDLIEGPPGFPLSDHGYVLKPFEAQSLFHSYKISEFEDGTPSIHVRVSQGIAGCSALIIKSCYEMEGPYLDFMKAYIKKPILLTGPLVPEPTHSNALSENFASWLAQFSAKSVIFCTFGSETFLTREEIRELALGLELTGLPFFLVLNFPKNVDSRAELECALPLGFLERTKERGLVHVGWVQQQLILEHVNVGCYLCHAGLSSIVEALVNDCQLVLLPQKLDQFFNARLVGEKGIMRTGIEVNTRNEDGYFGNEDIFAAVKAVMVDVEQEPGKTIRLNQLKWRDFLRQNEVQEKFILDMVVEMKRIVHR